MDLPHVFAKVTASVPMPGGYPVIVQAGTHWLADDPVVELRPDLFTADCRYGLAWSGDPPECLSVPPDGEGDLAPATAAAARGRPRAARL